MKINYERSNGERTIRQMRVKWTLTDKQDCFEVEIPNVLRDRLQGAIDSLIDYVAPEDNIVFWDGVSYLITQVNCDEELERLALIPLRSETPVVYRQQKEILELFVSGEMYFAPE